MIAESDTGAEVYESYEGPRDAATTSDDDTFAEETDAEASARFDREIQEAIGLGNDPGLGILVELAKKGECNPWDVDVVSLTDRYLDAMDEATFDARDLGRVARLVFYASCLIHLKAQVMAAEQRDLDYDGALEQAFEDELGGMFGGNGSWRPQLRPDDQPLDYGFLRGPGVDPALLLSPREQPLRSRGLTLVDLINALRDYDDRLAQRELLDSEPDFDADMALVECVGSSHQDDLDQDLIDVRHLLWKLLGKGEEAPACERVELSELVSETRTRAAAYLALLFLAQDEEIYLEQSLQDFYGSLYVVRGAHFGEVRAGVALDEDERGPSELSEEDDEDEEDGWSDLAVEVAEAAEAEALVKSVEVMVQSGGERAEESGETDVDPEAAQAPVAESVEEDA